MVKQELKRISSSKSYLQVQTEGKSRSTDNEVKKMNVSAKSLGIGKLDVGDQSALIGEILDGISGKTESLPLSDEFKDEIDKRIEEANENPDDGLSWEKAKKNALDRLKK